MTNHIEEMMKAAGVKPYKHTYFECKGGRSTISLCPQLGDPEKWCENECEEMQEKQEFLYPAFTPAKQLELIKLLPSFRCQREWGSDWAMDYIDEKTCKGFRACNLSFENTLAELIINLIVRKWIDKTEVKRILEDD